MFFCAAELLGRQEDQSLYKWGVVKHSGIDRTQKWSSGGMPDELPASELSHVHHILIQIFSMRQYWIDFCHGRYLESYQKIS